MTYQTPCQNPDNDPNDWFIGRDGKQYPDDPFDTEEQSEAAAKREALIRRRRARAACYECYFRMQCLDIALEDHESHGTWGGYYEEELRQIRNMRDMKGR